MRNRVIDAENGVVICANGTLAKGMTKAAYLTIHAAKERRIFVHRLIWESVHGPIPAGMQVNHINGIKKDNRVANLELVTPSENQKHAFRIGLCSNTGERNSQAKLTQKNVDFIRTNRGVLSIKKMALMFGVTRSAVYYAQTGRSWKTPVQKLSETKE